MSAAGRSRHGGGLQHWHPNVDPKQTQRKPLASHTSISLQIASHSQPAVPWLQVLKAGVLHTLTSAQVTCLCQPGVPCLQALNAGVLKVMSKMGISTIASYKGAQIFECLGMADEVVDACFVGTASRIAGVGYQTLAEDQMRVHGMAYGSKFMSASMADAMALPNPGDYHWRSVLPSVLPDLPAMQLTD